LLPYKVEVTTKYLKTNIPGAALFKLPPGFFDVKTNIDINELGLPKLKNTKIIFVVNKSNTIIRTAAISKPKVSTKIKKELINNNFPICEQLNENTHVFDGKVFVNEKKEMQFLMAAIPLNVSDVLTKIGEFITGEVKNILSIDVIENILAEEYRNNKDLMLMLPQDNNLRLILIKNNLPVSVSTISNNLAYRKDELMRFISENNTKCEAVFTNSNEEENKNWEWVYDYFC